MTGTLYRIDDGELCNRVRHDLAETQAGTYTLLGVDDWEQPLVIRRFLGDDPEGTLYYGMSENLPNRLGQLRQTICAIYGQESYTSGNHVAGWKLAQLRPVLDKVLPFYNRYRVRVRPCQEFKADGEAHWSAYEKTLLASY